MTYRDVDILVGESSISIAGTESRWAGVMCKLALHKWTFWNLRSRDETTLLSCDYQERRCVTCGKYQKAFVLISK